MAMIFYRGDAKFAQSFKIISVCSASLRFKGME